MNFCQVMSGKYPCVAWQGRSKIHVSVCGSMPALPKSLKASAVVQTLLKASTAKKFYATLTTVFHDFEWLLNPEQFEHLFLADVRRHWLGGKDTQDPSKIQNPVTGNVFHLIARDGKLVGGIRFWFDLADGGQRVLCWRFRITATTETKTETTTRIKQTLTEAQMELVAAGIVELNDVELAEPPQEVAEPQKETLYLTE